MTREEAIKILSIRDGHGIPSGYIGGYAEAIEVAVEALTAKEFSPKEFANEMRCLDEMNDPEIGHYKADKLMCELLTKLGYGEGVKIFEGMGKWYA